IAIATALNVWVAPLAAQDTPVAFVHGLNSSGITWQSMRSSLDAELAINHVSPNLSSFQVYSTQADALHTKLVASFPSNSPVVAVMHSNGGVVTRRYLTTHATPYIDRHLSIGSPHYGAPLAQRVVTGQVTSWAEDIF